MEVSIPRLLAYSGAGLHEVLLSISSTLRDPCAPPSPTQTPAHSHVQRISHQNQPVLCYSIPWDAQTFSPLTKMERGRAPSTSAAQESLGHLHHVAWPQHSASLYTPSTMGAPETSQPQAAPSTLGSQCCKPGEDALRRGALRHSRGALQHPHQGGDALQRSS